MDMFYWLEQILAPTDSTQTLILFLKKEKKKETSCQLEIFAEDQCY